MTIPLRKSYLPLLFAASLLSSCLDVGPESAIPQREAMQTADDADQVLLGIYAGLKGAALFSGLLTQLPDLQSDFVYAVDGFSNTYGNIWQWDIRPTTTETESVYGALYNVISRCNFYLDCIDGVMARETDDEELEVLETSTGEVHCIRALCYSKLIECFCKAYDPATAAEEPGVVLRTKFFTPEPIRRASLADSYAFVLDELALAEKMIDPDYDTPCYALMSHAAAEALHARVALYMQNWDDAIAYATKVIDNDRFTLTDATRHTYSATVNDFRYLWSDDLGTEAIWRIGFTTTSYGGALGSIFLGFSRDYTYYYPDYVPAQSVLDLYGASDLRASSYFASELPVGYAYGLDWPLIVKYMGNRQLMAVNIYEVNMPKPFRLAEQYLIRAEALCRKPQPDYAGAGRDLTALRLKRGCSSLTVNERDWLKNISDERVRELYMEGFRLNDLKRWGKAYADAVGDGTWSIVRSRQANSLAEGSELKVRWDDPLFVWPIPQSEIDAPGADIAPNDSNGRKN